MKETAVQQSLHQHVDAACYIHVLGHVIAAWLQVRDVRCCFEYLCYIEQIEIDPDFMRHPRQMKAAIAVADCRGNNPGSVLKSFTCADIAVTNIARQKFDQLLTRRNTKFIPA